MEFKWVSPLGISVALFLLQGALWILVGALTPVLLNTRIDQQGGLIISGRTDKVVFGGSPSELLQNDPALAKLRTILVNIISGLLVAAGVLVFMLAWFALRKEEVWALAALAMAGTVVLPFWLLVLWPYLRAGAPLALFDLPPFMWVPASLLIPATVLGRIGLR